MNIWHFPKKEELQKVKPLYHFRKCPFFSFVNFHWFIVDFLGFQNHWRWWLQPWKLWKKSCDQPRQRIKRKRHYFANKGPSGQSYSFSSSHIRMWESCMDYTESWALKSWFFWTVVLEKTLENPLESKEISPDSPGFLLPPRTCEKNRPLTQPAGTSQWLPLQEMYIIKIKCCSMNPIHTCSLGLFIRNNYLCLLSQEHIFYRVH